MKLSSPLRLHKCWPGAYTVILAVVPPRAGECRFVRVTSVLIFARAPACVAFVLARTPGQPGTFARNRRAPRPPLRASRTRHPARRHRHAGPGRTAISHRNAAHRQTRRHRTTRTLGKDHRAHQARLSITPAHWPAPGRQRTLCLLPGDSNPPEPRTTTTHSKEKRLLSISKPRRSPILALPDEAGWNRPRGTDLPILYDDRPGTR